MINPEIIFQNCVYSSLFAFHLDYFKDSLTFDFSLWFLSIQKRLLQIWGCFASTNQISKWITRNLYKLYNKAGLL